MECPHGSNMAAIIAIVQGEQGGTMSPFQSHQVIVLPPTPPTSNNSQPRQRPVKTTRKVPFQFVVEHTLIAGRVNKCCLVKYCAECGEMFVLCTCPVIAFRKAELFVFGSSSLSLRASLLATMFVNVTSAGSG